MRIPDETLNHLGKVFVAEQMNLTLGIAFGQYVTNPDLYDRMLLEQMRKEKVH